MNRKDLLHKVCLTTLPLSPFKNLGDYIFLITLCNSDLYNTVYNVYQLRQNQKQDAANCCKFGQPTTCLLLLVPCYSNHKKFHLF